MAALTVLAASSAFVCLLAAAQPTGIGWLDDCYRMAVGVTLVLAGSRARRWALIVGAALVAAGSLGPSLLLGLIALVLALMLVGRNRRDRVWGGAIGALVAICAFHLTISLFLGSSTIVGVAAAAPILWSGYRMSSRRVRRGWRRGVKAAMAFVVLACAAAGVMAVLSVGEVESGVAATKAGVAAVQSGRESLAAQRFDDAARELGRASARTNAWWVSLARAVPIAGQNLRVVQEVSRSGTELTRAAGDIARNVDYERLQLRGGGVDTKLLASFRAPVARTASTLGRADSAVSAVRSPWNLGPLEDRLDSFRTRIGTLRRQAALASLAVDRAPAMLGVGGARNYLVLLGDPSEARDLGGHLGNWAELTADEGRLTLDRVGVPGDLTLEDDPGAASLLSGMPPSLTAMKPLTFPQNWGADPDMSVVERLSAALFQRKTGQRIDGVFYADPTAFADFVAITGPIAVPGLATPVTAANAVAFLTSTQFTAFPTESAGDAATTQLVHDVFDRLTTTRLPGPKELATLFAPATAQGRFRLSSSVAADRPLLADLGLDGAWAVPEGGDVLGVINRNANPSKIDSFLHRRTRVDVKWNPSSGLVTEAVDVTLTNNAPVAGLPPVVIGNGAGLPSGTNLTDVALLTTYQLDRAEIDGQRVATQPVYDGRYWRYTVRVQIPAGQSVTVRYQVRGRVLPSTVYHLFVVGQPLANRGRIDVHLHAAAGALVPGRGMVTSGSSGSLALADDRDTQVAVRLHP